MLIAEDSLQKKILFQIVDLANPDRAPVEITAHDSLISCLAMNLHGTRLATASHKVSLS